MAIKGHTWITPGQLRRLPKASEGHRRTAKAHEEFRRCPTVQKVTSYYRCEAKVGPKKTRKRKQKNHHTPAAPAPALRRSTRIAVR